MKDDTVLLLSIRSQYASLIFSGAKRYELRRTKPRVKPGTLAWVYSPSPHKQMVGGFTVRGVIEGSPKQLWLRIGPESGVTRSVFMEYYDGVTVAYAIQIDDAWELATPVGLDILRHRMPNFHPPQVFQYLDIQKQRKLMPKANRYSTRRLMPIYRQAS